MFGALISGFLSSRNEAAFAKHAAEKERFRKLDAAIRHEQSLADDFMRRHHCKGVIIKPDGSMAALQDWREEDQG